MSLPALSVTAPAKINLCLHATGRRTDGYHLLDSVVAFADVGDAVRVRAAKEFSFMIEGPFAAAFAPADRGENNLVVRAARLLAAAVGRHLAVEICLTKNLPLAAGLGGGSADAAAVVRALLQLWEIAPAAVPDLDRLLLSVGADVPVCFHGQPARLQGIGEILTPLPALPALPAVLVNTGEACSTATVFRALKPPFREPIDMPAQFADSAALLEFLCAQENDLTAAACTVAPSIAATLSALAAEKECQLARMAGSGATCFGLFSNAAAAREAAARLTREFPRGWVRAVMIG